MLPSTLAGQTLSSGALRVDVQAAGPVFGARVVATAGPADADAGRVLGERSNGRYAADLLPPDDYAVLVERLGFRPVRITGVPVRAGEVTALAVVLTAMADPAAGVDERAYAGAPVAAAGHLAPRALRALPFADRTGEELARLSSLVGPGTEMGGLPARFTTLTIDGFRLEPALHPFVPLASDRRLAFPLVGVRSGTVDAVPAGAELGGSLAGQLAAHSDVRPRVEGFAYASGGALYDGADGDASATLLQGGGAVAGSFGDGGDGYALALEARRAETPFERALSPGATVAALIGAARESLDVDLTGDAGVASGERSGIAAAALGHWTVADAGALGIRLLADLRPETLVADAGAPGGLLRRETGDVALAADLGLPIAAGITNDLRVLAHRSTAEYDDAGLLAGDSLPVWLSAVPAALTAGPAPSGAAGSERTTLRVHDAVHVTLGEHRLRGGVEAGIARHVLERTAAAPRVLFADSARLAQRIGYRIDEASPGRAELDVPELAVFAQDDWRPSERLALRLGLRADLGLLPDELGVPDAEWLRLTGIDNALIPERTVTIGPVVGFRWTLAPGWAVHGAGRSSTASPSAALLAEVATRDGRTATTRYLGALDAALEPVDANAAVEATALSFLADDYRAPRSDAVSLGVTGTLGALAVRLEGRYRSTRFLPLREDVNLQTVPASTAADGRLVYAELARQGPLVVARPGTNRRFPDYDQVWRIASGAEATRTALTLGAAHAGEHVFLDAEYTYSHTEDDWVGAADAYAGTALPPLLAEGAADWTAGRSDFDRPHRLAASVAVTAPLGGAGATIAALYTLRSGRPFTPGFARGVDINGDGLPFDPAFIDAEVEGIDPLLDDWGCLRSAAGELVERNACRAEREQRLDLRLAIGGLALGRATLTAFVDALDVLGDVDRILDTAVYSVVPDAPITTTDGVTTIPIVANLNFGEPLVEMDTGRRLRLGLSITY